MYKYNGPMGMGNYVNKLERLHMQNCTLSCQDLFLGKVDLKINII